VINTDNRDMFRLQILLGRSGCLVKQVLNFVRKIVGAVMASWSFVFLANWIVIHGAWV
jgi:hypothetical protein